MGNCLIVSGVIRRAQTLDAWFKFAEASLLSSNMDALT